jgi:hypothetical protein
VEQPGPHDRPSRLRPSVTDTARDTRDALALRFGKQLGHPVVRVVSGQRPCAGRVDARQCGLASLILV